MIIKNSNLSNQTEINYTFNYKKQEFINILNKSNSLNLCFLISNLTKKELNELQKTLNEYECSLFSISKIFLKKNFNSQNYYLYKNLFISKTFFLNFKTFDLKKNLLILEILKKKFFLLGGFLNLQFFRPSELLKFKTLSLKKNILTLLKTFKFSQIKFIVNLNLNQKS